MIVNYVQGNIAEALPLAAIFVLIDRAPLSELPLPAAHLGFFICAGWIFFSGLSSFKKEDSGKES